MFANLIFGNRGGGGMNFQILITTKFSNGNGLSVHTLAVCFETLTAAMTAIENINNTYSQSTTAMSQHAIPLF
jgi:hypothetical protein